MGFTLAAFWTRLKEPLIEDSRSYLHYTVRMFKWLSYKPAQTLGLTNRGAIEAGRYADLVAWQPETKFRVTFSYSKF
jgi:alpha-D-ribose 1-methylphosphonate 5-triphosphate diphosphatase PhnM